MINELTGMALASGLCLCVCLSSRADTTSYQDWQANDNSNPADPTVVENSAGVGNATMVIGFLGVGWLPDLLGLGNQTGLWDLGSQDGENLQQDTRGRILLGVPNPLPADMRSSTELRLRIAQFIDGFIYTGGLTFSVPGANLKNRIWLERMPDQPGAGWVEDEYHWQLTSNPEQISLCITGAVSGTLVDRIRLETISVLPPIEQLVIKSITKSDEGLHVSWVGGLPPYQLYVTTNALIEGSWQQAGPLITTNSAEIQLTAPMEFIRVRGSS